MRSAARTTIALIAVLLLPATARAASVEVTPEGELRYSAAAGERNSVEFDVTQDAAEYRVFENAVFAKGAGRATLTTGAGCRRDPKVKSPVFCSTAGVKRVAVSLADRDDSLILRGDLHVPATYSGGRGTDSAFFVADDERPMTMSADGMADDGPFGRDDVRPDVEVLSGGSFADRLVAGSHGSRLAGGEGDDTMIGGAGDDDIGAAYVETVGLDSGDFHRVGTDTISCRAGHDYVLADSTDRIAPDCEVVGKDVGRRPTGGFTFLFRGSNAGEKIQPEYFWNDATVRGRGGDDLLLASPDFGDTKIYGERGDDRIQGGEGNDVLDGGRGDDRIRANEANRRTRDRIRCGRGLDRAWVDGRDRVARDCERVFRVTAK
ncbi:MAG TPA: hypothetical protein VF545_01170 [Thermoleophilaceae bacterium]